MSHPTFLVSRFKNRNGVFSWRVDGRLNGVRIRRNFKTQEEAAAEKAALEIKALQLASSLHAVTTTLSTDQVHEAETAFRRLADRKRSLSFYVDFALANHCEPEQQKPLAGAVDAYVATKVHEHGRKLISPSQLITIQRHMKVLKKHFLGLAVAELTPARLTPYFQRGDACLKTYNNRRGVVSTFLKFAEQQEWITTNPIKKVPYSVWKTYHNPTCLAEDFRASKERLTWHVARIYRTRNQLAHHGQEPAQARLLLDNLHFYLSTAISRFLTALKDNPAYGMKEAVEYWKNHSDQVYHALGTSPHSITVSEILTKSRIRTKACPWPQSAVTSL